MLSHEIFYSVHVLTPVYKKPHLLSRWSLFCFFYLFCSASLLLSTFTSCTSCHLSSQAAHYDLCLSFFFYGFYFQLSSQSIICGSQLRVMFGKTHNFFIQFITGHVFYISPEKLARLYSASSAAFFSGLGLGRQIIYFYSQNFFFDP